MFVGDSRAKQVDWLVVKPREHLTLPGGATETVTITALPTELVPSSAAAQSIRTVVGMVNDS